ncbi:hypothetical protein [Methanocalculus sp. MC3]
MPDEATRATKMGCLCTSNCIIRFLIPIILFLLVVFFLCPLLMRVL